jgi:UDP-N-acetylglucosamine 4,6-dehydratase/5-epimerase
MLITGGTGAFGQAFVERMLHRGHRRVCVYSRDEFKQAQMREKFGDTHVRYFIGDVRDKERLRRAMEGVEVVVHAAALKRIEVGAYNPGEMVKTNVMGTMNVIEAAHDAKVRKVVYLSTDKAYQPVSAYGQSKALAESLVLASNNTESRSGPKFCVTRYGNVAGSTGSVIPKWRSAQRATMTDPECTRFFMWMDEAIDLVLESIATGKLLNIPELPAYRLGDLATAMGLEPEVTGLPAHEKLHEGMADGNTSDVARRMSIDEIRTCLRRLDESLQSR